MDVALDSPGVWEEHADIELTSDGFFLEAQPNALVRLNGAPVQHALLRNGDQFEVGAVKIQFWLDDAIQKESRRREAVVWAILVGVTLAQVVLAYCLPK